MTRFFLLAAASLALGACATPAADEAPPEARDCFRNADIDSYSFIDEHTLGVKVSADRAYAFASAARLDELRTDPRVAIVSQSSWICVGDAHEVEIRALGPFENTWVVDEIKRLPPEPPAESS